MAPLTGLSIRLRRKLYPGIGAAPARLVFADLALDVAAGSFVCLLGPSGSGKTTLLNIVAGLDRDFEGEVAFSDGKRPRLGYVFQTPRLLPWRTALQNVALPLGGGPGADDRARDTLAAVGLSEALATYPARLSLGMQRRVALARAFAIEPQLLLMDEPFVSLDEAGAERLRDLLESLLRVSPATVLFVTHDSREAVRLGDRIVAIAGSPARTARDFPVSLTHSERRDPQSIDHIRASLDGVGAAGPGSPSGREEAD